MITEVCNRDIWKEFPGASVEDRPVFESDALEPQQAALGWKDGMGRGRADAILALQLVLAPHVAELTLAKFYPVQDEHGNHVRYEKSWNSFEIRADSDFLQRLFRGATNAHLAVLKDGGKQSSTILPSLRKIKIRSQLKGQFLDMRKVLGYLTLPTLEHASVIGLDDEAFFDQDMVDVKLWIRSPALNYLTEGVLVLAGFFSVVRTLKTLHTDQPG